MAALQAAAQQHLPGIAAVALEPPRFFASEAAGLMLLTSVIRRLGWWRTLDNPHVFSFVVAGAASRFTSTHWNSSDRFDPALELLAGSIDDFDRRGMIHFCDCADAAPVATALSLPSHALRRWDDLFDAAAQTLARTLAERVRGFRKASFDGIRKSFIFRPGRIRIEERRVLVTLDAYPLNVALHLSGMDDPIDSVEWLKARRVEFLLEGL